MAKKAFLVAVIKQPNSNLISLSDAMNDKVRIIKKNTSKRN